MNLIFAFLLTTGLFAETFKLAIITDSGGQERAEEFIRWLRQQPPFNSMPSTDLHLEIRPIANMGCFASTATTDGRNVQCNQTVLGEEMARAGAHRAIAITSSPSEYGGSGGPSVIPVGTIGTPNHIILHEYLHAVGIADEYTYNPTTDAETIAGHCRNNYRPAPNEAYFQDSPPYASDAIARQRHTRQIPWVLSSHPIINGTELGSPEMNPVINGSQQIGIYRGGRCPVGSDGRRTWLPYQKSIMNDDPDPTIYPLYAAAIREDIRRRQGVSSSGRRTPRSVRSEVQVNPQTNSGETQTNGSSVVSPE